ncbi:hypothetical protein ANO11243_033070 [Dothideomycetidae sp. 11243]|nr:hypothetical protein ANO11243_033070 [fungal sp. No.11243]
MNLSVYQHSTLHLVNLLDTKHGLQSFKMVFMPFNAFWETFWSSRKSSLRFGEAHLLSVGITFVASCDGITTVPYAPTCTAINQNTYAVYDSYQNELWYYMCGAGTNNPSMNTNTNANSWRDCFQQCDTTASCTGFSYNNGNNYGEGGGVCSLKSANPQAFSSTATLVTTRVGAIRARYGTCGIADRLNHPDM